MLKQVDDWLCSVRRKRNRIDDWLYDCYQWVLDKPIRGVLSLLYIACLIGVASRWLTLSINVLNPPLASFENRLHTSWHMNYLMMYMTLFLAFRVLTLPLRLTHSSIDRNSGRITRWSGPNSAAGNIVAAISILILPLMEMNLLLLIVQTDYKYSAAPSAFEWSKITGLTFAFALFLIQLAAMIGVLWGIEGQYRDSLGDRFLATRVSGPASGLESFIIRYWDVEILFTRQLPAEILIYMPNILLAGWLCTSSRLFAAILAFMIVKYLTDMILRFIACRLDWSNLLWLREVCWNSVSATSNEQRLNAIRKFILVFISDPLLIAKQLSKVIVSNMMHNNDEAFRQTVRVAFEDVDQSARKIFARELVTTLSTGYDGNPWHDKKPGNIGIGHQFDTITYIFNYTPPFTRRDLFDVWHEIAKPKAGTISDPEFFRLMTR